MVSPLARWPVILLVVLLGPTNSFSDQFTSHVLSIAQGNRTPPEGQRITASDGDTIVIEGDARVRIIRRRPAFVRLVADPERRFAVLIAEHLTAPGAPAKRQAHKAYTFAELTGEWPLATRWEGAAWLEEHGADEQGRSVAGVGLETTQGTILFGHRGGIENGSYGSASTTLSYQILGISGGSGGQSFDQTETQQVAMAMKSAAQRAQGSSVVGGPGYSAWTSTTSGLMGPARALPPAPDGAVRVGGNVPPPRKLHHVDPVTPELARAARVQGVVIVEIMVGTDGAVKDARILRSIPVLDQAALDAVRQWRFEPPLVNGQAVPVIMTAPIAFGPV